MLLGGGKGEPKNQLQPQHPVRALPGQTKNTATRFARDCAFSKPLLRRFGLADKAGALGEHCSSSAAACVLCKLLGRVAQPPLYQLIRRNHEGAARQGALPFGYFRLGKQGKVTSRRATPGTQNIMRAAHLLGCLGNPHTARCASLIGGPTDAPYARCWMLELPRCNSTGRTCKCGLQGPSVASLCAAV